MTPCAAVGRPCGGRPRCGTDRRAHQSQRCARTELRRPVSAPPPPTPPRRRCLAPPAATLSSSDSDGESTQHVVLSESEGATAAAAGSMIAEELEEAAADAAAAALAAEARGGPAGPEPAASAAGQQGSLFATKEVQEMLSFAVPALGMVLAGLACKRLAGRCASGCAVHMGTWGL